MVSLVLRPLPSAILNPSAFSLALIVQSLVTVTWHYGVITGQSCCCLLISRWKHPCHIGIASTWLVVSYSCPACLATNIAHNSSQVQCLHRQSQQRENSSLLPAHQVHTCDIHVTFSVIFTYVSVIWMHMRICSFAPGNMQIAPRPSSSPVTKWQLEVVWEQDYLSVCSKQLLTYTVANNY